MRKYAVLVLLFSAAILCRAQVSYVTVSATVTDPRGGYMDRMGAALDNVTVGTRVVQ